MTEIKMGGRIIPLMFTTFEMIAIQRDIGCTASELREKVFGIVEDEDNPDNTRMTVAHDPDKLEKLGTLIRILGNAGLEENGQEPNLTDKWVLRHMKPGYISGYAVLAMAEVVDGMMMESPALSEDESGPVDEVLEEQRTKKEQGS